MQIFIAIVFGTLFRNQASGGQRRMAAAGCTQRVPLPADAVLHLHALLASCPPILLPPPAALLQGTTTDTFAGVINICGALFMSVCFLGMLVSCLLWRGFQVQSLG